MGKRASTIKRAPHDKDNPYKMIRQATLEDGRLSWEARGMIGYLLMKPDNWTITVPNLMREGGCGRDKTYRIVGELVELDYLERIDTREEGKFSETTYHVHESPCPEKPYTAEPLTEKPLTANPQHSNNTYSTKNENSTKDDEGERAPAPDPIGDVDFWGNGDGSETYNPPSVPYSGRAIDDKVPEGSGNTPVQVYHEVHPLHDKRCELNNPARVAIGKSVTDLGLWREVVNAWALQGNKPTNIKGQLDWYKDPSRFRADLHPVNGTARASPGNGHHLRGAERNMSIVDQFEAQFGDMEIEL